MYTSNAKHRLIPENLATHQACFALSLVSNTGVVLMKTCKVEGCEKSPAKGYLTCSMHLARMYRYKSYEIPVVKIKDLTAPQCRVNGCDKKVRTTENLCGWHDANWKIYLNTLYGQINIPILPDVITHICKVHGALEKQQVETTGRKSKNGRTYHTCRSCKHITDKAFKIRHPERVKARDQRRYMNNPLNSIISNLKKRGLSPERYLEMFQEQNNKCSLCSEEETLKMKGKKTFSLAIDHCHESGLVRQLLCSKCNRGLGFFKDSPELLRKAADYIEHWRKKHAEAK